MRIIARSTLKKFWEQNEYADSEQQLESWIAEAKKAKWERPDDIKEQYHTASILKKSRVVFNIKGNDYRLVVHINYSYGVVYIRFIGTHDQYDQINAEEI